MTQGRMKTVLITFLIFTITPQFGHAQPAAGRQTGSVTTERAGEGLELLNASMASLSDELYRRRRMGGYAMLGLGIGSGIGGIVTLSAADNHTQRVVGWSLLGGGAALAGLSAFPFHISSEAERLYREFREMPEGTLEEQRQKFTFGDRRFEDLARKKRRERLVEGSLEMAVGVLSLLLIDSTEDRLGTASAPLISGIASLFIPSEEERRYATYRKSRIDIFADAPEKSFQAGIVPLPRAGGAALLQFRF